MRSWQPFRSRLALITALGLAIRLVYALVVMRDVGPTGDAYEFHLLANVLSDQGSYLQPLPFLREGERIPTAEKPPLYPAYLALGSLLGASSYAAHRAMSCLLGAAAIAVIGLLGRKVAGERAGLVAAALAAVYPMLIVLDGSGRTESLYVLLVALLLLAAYRLKEAPTPLNAALLGVLLALAALTRSESLLLLVLLVLPALLLAVPGARQRLRLGAVTVAAMLVVLAPYQARNLLTFDRPVALSTNEGGLLAGANCDLAYYSSHDLGTWPCYSALSATKEFDESDVSWRLRRRALRYIGDNTGRLPAVVAVRVLRTWELWDVRDQAGLEARISERNLRFQQAGVLSLYLLGALAIWGAILLRRRGQSLSLLLAPVLLVTIMSALTYGTSRFRAAADVAIVVLAAVAVERLLERARRSRGTAAETP